MAGKTIEAGLRITADTAQAGKAVDDLGKKTTGAVAGVDKAGAAAVGATDKAAKGLGRSTDEVNAKLRQTQQQMRQLAPQFTDIFTQLQGGQSPLQVLIQQGGQIKDIFGGVGPAISAVASTITVARVAIGGAVGVVGALAAAAFQANRDQSDLNKTFALTGNIAATNAATLDRQAASIATSQQVSIGSAREILSLLVAQGNLTTNATLSTGRAVATLAKLTGQSAEDAVKAFDGQAEGITQWAIKANRAYNFLTAAQVDYIRSLESQGRVSEATQLANDALAGALQQRMAPTVSNLGRLWDSLTGSISKAWDTLKKNLRDQTPAERLAEITAKIESLSRSTTANAFGDAELNRLKAEAEQLRSQVNSDLLRAQNAADRQAEQNDLILKNSKQYKDAEANLALAANQVQLAQQTAFLDKRRSEIERANDAGLVSARAYAVALNKVDQDRLAAQRDALAKQIAIEQGRTVENPIDVLARDARVKGLQGQLVQIQDQIAQAASKGQGIVAAAALQDARDNAAEWAAVWQRAANQVRTFADQVATSRARLEGDPAARATAEAAAATAAVRRDLADLERDLTLRISLTIDPNQKAELQKQLDELRGKGAEAIDEATRAARFRSLQASAEQLQGLLQVREGRVRSAQDAGQITSEQAEEKILALRREQLPLLDRILELMTAIARSPDDQQTVEKLRAQVEEQRNLQTELERTARGSAVSSLSTALKDIETGAKSGKRALLDMVGSFASALLDVLDRRLAEQLVKQFEGALPGGGGLGGVLGNVGSFFSSFFHQGGVVGSSSVPRRSVSAAAFALAPRYHTGGIAGLMPGEVPLVAKVGETIRTVEQERALQGRLAGAGGVTIQSNFTLQAGTDAAGGAAVAERYRQDAEAFNAEWATRESRPGGVLWKLTNR